MNWGFIGAMVFCLVFWGGLIWVFADDTTYDNPCEIIESYTNKKGEIIITLKCLDETNGEIFYMISKGKQLNIKGDRQ